MPTTAKAAGPLAGLALFLAALPPGIASGESSAAPRPNVILIVADNQPARLLGAYGNSEIATPNIDALARSGVLFRNAFAASGVCSPTRAALLTGLMPSQTGIHVALPGQPELEGWSAIEEFRNLPQTLADAGYFTGLVGKYHLGRHERPQLGFSWWVTFPSGSHHNVLRPGESLTTAGITAWKNTSRISGRTRRSSSSGSVGTLQNPSSCTCRTTGPTCCRRRCCCHRAIGTRSATVKDTPSMPHEPIHPYLEAWARGRSPTGEMVREGTTAWRAINAINNPVAMINTAAETTMVDDGVGRLLEDAGGTGAAGQHAGHLHLGPGIALRTRGPLG